MVRSNMPLQPTSGAARTRLFEATVSDARRLLRQSVRRLIEEMTFPKKYAAASAPSEVLVLINRLVPQLIACDHPALIALREQFRCASIAEIEMTGHGFYADFETPADVPLATPLDFAGGHAEIALEGASAGERRCVGC
jgi:hypothetical protein